jgi:predicted DNA-binding transcriptional regulator AlpA
MQTNRICYTEREVSELLGIKVKTLQRWRLLGRGPRFVKAGTRLVRYPASGLASWIDSQPSGRDGGQAVAND